MNSNLLFEFSVNKENKTIHVIREFDADLALVWKAWTTAELLDQWWAPRPYRNQTRSLDFREGGRWHYAMISPENQTHFCLFDYEKIEDQKSYSGLDAFCDEAENIDTSFSRMHWENIFKEATGRTTVHITVTLETLDTLEKILEMGFQQGFTMGMDQLDELLPTLKK